MFTPAMAHPYIRPDQSCLPGPIPQQELWCRFLEQEKELLADSLLPEDSETMTGSSSTDSKSVLQMTPKDKEQTMSTLIELSIESILHNVLFDIHRSEKVARMQTAVVEVEQRAEKLGKKVTAESIENTNTEDTEPVETKAAVVKSGQVHLRGNPMKSVKQIRCPNCRLPRLLYPRIGFNSRPLPDPSQQYCKAEPMIILDKHDVHGQRKKGVKVKGQAKGKNKKKNDPGSPASENSDPLTPSSSIPADTFEFKEIDYPAAKCPNRDSHLGDHWKSVNVFATHLNGSCYLKRDRTAGREANAKITGTPRDSRANSPKAAVTNGVKRKAAASVDEDSPAGSTASDKKKQKLLNHASETSSTNKKKKPGTGPSKLREQLDDNDPPTPKGKDLKSSPVKAEPSGDTIQVAPKKREKSIDSISTPTEKLKIKLGSLATSGVGGGSGSGPTGAAKKKPPKSSKKG